MKKAIVTVWILLLLFAARFWWVSMPWLLPAEPTIIDGFSAELTELLVQQYGLKIPEGARFVSGCYTNSLRDPHLAIQFELDVSGKTPKQVDKQLHDLMLTDGIWSDWGGGCDPDRTVANDIFGYDVIYTKAFTCKGKEFTSLFYSIAEDGVVQCSFCGPHPDGTPIRAPADSTAGKIESQSTTNR